MEEEEDDDDDAFISPSSEFTSSWSEFSGNPYSHPQYTSYNEAWRFSNPALLMPHREAPPLPLLPLPMTVTSYHGNQINLLDHGLSLHVAPV
ncbi:hypothetical protein CRUP_037423 [Coryphaenoides rupestris]|nr:hypothetical protein CRUP_037423 [Coryphaenoides rupestris]